MGSLCHGCALMVLTVWGAPGEECGEEGTSIRESGKGQSGVRGTLPVLGTASA